MLQTIPNHEARASVRPDLDVEILSVATAVPSNKLPQGAMLERAKEVFPHLAHLEPVYANTGIDTRYSCMPLEWYLEPRGWKDRSDCFEREALILLEQAAIKAIDDAGLQISDIDSIVTVSSTGLCVPSLDAKLANRMGLRNDIERLPIFGLGCAGGVSGMARSARLAQSMSGGHVLLLSVELCSLNYRLADTRKAMFISTALFGDGAAAMVLRGTGSHQDGNGAVRHPRISAVGEHLWFESEDMMGWSIEEDGFGVIISTTIPSFTHDNIKDAAQTFLTRNGCDFDDLAGIVLHPGGRKVLEAVESALELDGDELRHSRDVLRDYGNMSSPTVLFVLARMLASGASGKHLMAALGPGFSISFGLLEL
jgi:alkylresorcinol/alkylpyrone synthase